MAGSVINQDGGLGHTFTTPGAENFFHEHCRADSNEIIGHFKAHIYNKSSLTMVSQAFNEDQPHDSGTSSKKEVDEDDPDTIRLLTKGRIMLSCEPNLSRHLQKSAATGFGKLLPMEVPSFKACQKRCDLHQLPGRSSLYRRGATAAVPRAVLPQTMTLLMYTPSGCSPTSDVTAEASPRKTSSAATVVKKKSSGISLGTISISDSPDEAEQVPKPSKAKTRTRRPPSIHDSDGIEEVEGPSTTRVPSIQNKADILITPPAKSTKIAPVAEDIDDPISSPSGSEYHPHHNTTNLVDTSEPKELLLLGDSESDEPPQTPTAQQLQDVLQAPPLVHDSEGATHPEDPPSPNHTSHPPTAPPTASKVALDETGYQRGADDTQNVSARTEPSLDRPVVYLDPPTSPLQQSNHLPLPVPIPCPAITSQQLPIPPETVPHPSTRPKPRPVMRHHTSASRPEDADDAFKRRQPAITSGAIAAVSAATANLLAAEEGFAGGGSIDASLDKGLVIDQPSQESSAHYNTSGILQTDPVTKQRESSVMQPEYDYYVPPCPPPHMHYETHDTFAQHQPPRAFPDRLPSSGMPRGMQEDAPHHPPEGGSTTSRDYNNHPQYVPVNGRWPDGGPYFQPPYPVLDNSRIPPSAVPTQGGAIYNNIIPPYGEMSGYYYRGQPNSQFRPLPTIVRRSPYPDDATLTNPHAHVNAPPDHLNAHEEHKGQQSDAHPDVSRE
ncbi:hypothetical protein BU15DRAFT_80471 [Melanogaster broomeanus]|nr:hypothetical protein BU15DRAFT_80471 [Melanogaster broomeanus]